MAVRNLEQFCGKFHALLSAGPEISRLIAEGRILMGELVSRTEWFGDVLRKILFDREFSESQRPGIWPNEITLYRSLDRSFMILCYIWGPHESDVIHDHGSWGIIGSFMRPVGERKYRRMDDGRKEGYAELEESSSIILQPGETTHVLPLNKGIHKMENFGDDMAVTINIYGPNIRKGYVQFFSPERKSVSRIYPPRYLKEALAVRILGVMSAPWSEEILQRVQTSDLPDYIKKEGEISLSKLKSG